MGIYLVDIKQEDRKHGKVFWYRRIPRRGKRNADGGGRYKVGRFLGWYYGKKKPEEKCRVVIGKDTRRSSYMFEYSLVAGLTASGADAYLLHVTTTPSVSYVVRTEEFSCGIMISASHNPFYDNGIKVINEKGEKLEEEVITEIEKYLDGEMGEIPYAVREQIGRTVDYAAGRNRYIGYLISIATRSFKNKKVGLDCANGSASAIAKNVFDALGAETHVIHNNPDGVNINTNCGSTISRGCRSTWWRTAWTWVLPMTETLTAAWQWTAKETWWTATRLCTSAEST